MININDVCIIKHINSKYVNIIKSNYVIININYVCITMKYLINLIII